MTCPVCGVDEIVWPRKVACSAKCRKELKRRYDRARREAQLAATLATRPPYWLPRGKIGRYVDRYGYVRLLMPGHHMANIRGYVLEHRLVAEMTLGRPLLASEIVHHRDGNKGNNAPENLEVVGSDAEHLAKHRTRVERMPFGAENPLVPCGCGCGEMIRRYGQAGLPRTYKQGHTARKGQIRRSIVQALRGGPQKSSAIAVALRLRPHQVSSALWCLKAAGTVCLLAGNIWQLSPAHADRSAA